MYIIFFFKTHKHTTYKHTYSKLMPSIFFKKKVKSEKRKNVNENNKYDGCIYFLFFKTHTNIQTQINLEYCIWCDYISMVIY